MKQGNRTHSEHDLELRPSGRWISVLIAALTLVTVTVPVWSQAPFTGTTDVTLVEIPVQVVRHGSAVAGLTRDDFEILEGKKRHPIHSFEAVDLRRIDADAVPVMARRHVLFLFDLSSLDPATVARAQATALTAVRDMLHPADVAAVASYSPVRDTELVLGFTPDRDQLRLAIETLGVPGLFQPTPDALGLVVGARATSGHGSRTNLPDPGAAASAVCLHARTLDNDRGRAAAAERRAQLAAKSRSFAELARLLARVDGRKQVVLFSAGFDSDLFFAAGKSTLDARAAESGEIWDVDGDRVFGSSKIQRDLEQMLEAFRRADATIQAIDLSRSVAGGRASEAFDTPDRGTAGRESLFYLANETGGGLHRGAGDLRSAMERILERSNVTYLLTFQPRNLPLDGAYHPIKVRLKRAGRGMRVVHRSGYFAPVPWSSEGQSEQRWSTAELVTGARDGGSLALDFVPLPVLRVHDEVMAPFLVRIGGAGLLAGHYGDLLHVELHVYVFDQEGNIVQFRNQMLGLDLTQARERLERSGLVYYGALSLPPGTYRARVVARNNQAWTWGTHSTALEVAPAAGTTAELAPPPPRLVPRGDWVIARGADTEAIPYPFTIDGEIWLPSREADNRDAGSR